MKTFKDLKFTQPPFGNGIQARMSSPNNYGVSVVKIPGSYGYESGLYEVAILHDGDIVYDTGITSDVLGHQTKWDVTNVMKKVQELR